MTETVNILCMKWGKRYDAVYVNKLYYMVTRHLTIPFRFVCLTDDAKGIAEEITCFPFPKFDSQKIFKEPKKERGWKKLLTFSSPLYNLTGTTLFLDLDIVIVNNINVFFEPKDEFLIIRDWLRPTGNSSVYRFEISKYSGIIRYFLENQEHILSTYRNEQEFLTAYMKKNHTVAYWDEKIIKSFKRHCTYKGYKAWFKEPFLPDDAKIIVFHGNPKPHEAIAGKSGKWFRKILPTKWVDEHWR